MSLCLLVASTDDLAQKDPEALASVPSSLTGELRELDLEFWERLLKDNQLAYFFEWYKLYPCKVWSEERPNTEEDFLD